MICCLRVSCLIIWNFSLISIRLFRLSRDKIFKTWPKTPWFAIFFFIFRKLLIFLANISLYHLKESNSSKSYHGLHIFPCWMVQWSRKWFWCCYSWISWTYFSFSRWSTPLFWWADSVQYWFWRWDQKAVWFWNLISEWWEEGYLWLESEEMVGWGHDMI